MRKYEETKVLVGEKLNHIKDKSLAFEYLFEYTFLCYKYVFGVTDSRYFIF